MRSIVTSKKCKLVLLNLARPVNNRKVDRNLNVLMRCVNCSSVQGEAELQQQASHIHTSNFHHHVYAYVARKYHSRHASNKHQHAASSTTWQRQRLGFQQTQWSWPSHEYSKVVQRFRSALRQQPHRR